MKYLLTENSVNSFIEITIGFSTLALLSAFVLFVLRIATGAWFLWGWPISSHANGVEPTQDDYNVPMVLIPEGEFKMGDVDGYYDEEPAHTVYLDAFYIDIYEVTHARYQDCVDAGVCETVDSYNSGSNYPVTDINWYQAQTYCEWRGARLPTEAEWEKAARGGLSEKDYPWGNQDPVCKLDAGNGANYGQCNFGLMEVGEFSPNNYGLYDTVGNVWEWVADWYDSDYYDNSSYENPEGPTSGDYRVLRGGSWYSYGNRVRSANRHWDYPGSAYHYIGFRCARSFP